MKCPNLFWFLGVLFITSSAMTAGCGGASKESYFGAPLAQPKQKEANGQPADKNVVEKQPDTLDVRKIIYTARVQLFVDGLDRAEKELSKLVEKNKGYIAESDIQGRTGKQRRGTWTVRIPVKHFKAFRESILDLGVPEQNSLNSQEITREYVDLDGRLKNALATEQRLKEHLKKDTKEVKDILAVEKEISRVHAEVESMQGQLRLWDNQVALTTIYITIFEREDYVPPQAHSFGTVVGETFMKSINGLIATGKTLVLVVVAMAPWLVVLAVFIVPVWWLARRSLRHKQQLPLVQAVEQPEPPQEENPS